MTPRARGYLFFGITLVLAGIFSRLGIWQLSRLRERRAYNRTVEAARMLPPVSLDSGVVLPAAESLAFRRVSVTGRYDNAGEVVLRGQSEKGVAGVRLVTPLRIQGRDTVVLVQRGFVPSPDATTVDQAAWRDTGVVRVAGVVSALPDSDAAADRRELKGGTTWRRVDLRAVRQQAGAPVLPILILQTPDSSLPATPRRDDPPALDDGPHLSYAIQWFAFTITALVAGVLVGLRGAGVRSER